MSMEELEFKEIKRLLMRDLCFLLRRRADQPEEEYSQADSKSDQYRG